MRRLIILRPDQEMAVIVLTAHDGKLYYDDGCSDGELPSDPDYILKCLNLFTDGYATISLDEHDPGAYWNSDESDDPKEELIAWITETAR